MMMAKVLPLALVLLITTLASAFTSVSYRQKKLSLLVLGSESWNGGQSSSSNGAGSIEQIEFKIYPDGRVEEKVMGIKGGNCQKVTESINEQLGKVVNSAPTEEMYEQKVVVDQTLINTESTGGTSWEGGSSW